MLLYYQSNPALLHPDAGKLILPPDYVERQLAMAEEIRNRKPSLIEPEKAVRGPKSVRVGAIGVKLGMSSIWLKNGERVAVTLVQIKECQVIKVRRKREEGGNDYCNEVQVGAVNVIDIHKMHIRQYGHYVSAGVSPKKKQIGFMPTKDALLRPGTELDAKHFVAGQYLRIQGISKDKGFQGVMRKWGMKGQPASHGQTKTHRKMGATGGGQDPGRIWPGKKMAGRMGKNKTTFYALKLYRVNTKYNVLWIHGSLPGNNGDCLIIRDSKNTSDKVPPFPMYFPERDEPLPEDIYDESVQQFTDESLSFEGLK